MCAHYEALREWERYAKYFGINQPQPPDQLPLHVFPTGLALMIRRPPELASGDDAVTALEVVIGHFGLLPGFAKDIKYGLRTYNARSETVSELASFNHIDKTAERKPGSYPDCHAQVCDLGNLGQQDLHGLLAATEVGEV